MEVPDILAAALRLNPEVGQTLILVEGRIAVPAREPPRHEFPRPR